MRLEVPNFIDFIQLSPDLFRSVGRRVLRGCSKEHPSGRSPGDEKRNPYEKIGDSILGCGDVISAVNRGIHLECHSVIRESGTR